MYETSFRILQYNDEYFYAIDLAGYHWLLYRFGLSDSVLKKHTKQMLKRIQEGKICLNWFFQYSINPIMIRTERKQHKTLHCKFYVCLI